MLRNCDFNDAVSFWAPLIGYDRGSNQHQFETLSKVVAALLTTVLPETHLNELPTTLEEAEKFGKEVTEEDLPLR